MPTSTNTALTNQSPAVSAKEPSRLRRWAVRGGLAVVVLVAALWGLFQWFVALQNRNVTSGVAIGQQAPDLALPDQNGRVRSLHDLSGPKGLLLVFVRSADW